MILGNAIPDLFLYILTVSYCIIHFEKKSVLQNKRADIQQDFQLVFFIQPTMFRCNGSSSVCKILSILILRI